MGGTHMWRSGTKFWEFLLPPLRVPGIELRLSALRSRLYPLSPSLALEFNVCGAGKEAHGSSRCSAVQLHRTPLCCFYKFNFLFICNIILTFYLLDCYSGFALKILQLWQDDGSGDKGACCHQAGPGFDPRSHAVRGENWPVCPLTST